MKIERTYVYNTQRERNERTKRNELPNKHTHTHTYIHIIQTWTWTYILTHIQTYSTYTPPPSSLRGETHT